MPGGFIFGVAQPRPYAAADNLNQYPTTGGACATYGANANLATCKGRTYTYDSMNRLTLASAPRCGL